MSQVIRPENLESALSDILDRFDSNSVKSANAVLKETMKDLFGSIIEQTPVGDFDPEHEGLLKGNWQLTEGSPAKGDVKARMPKRTRSSLKFPREVLGKRFYLTNNLPYANDVEYGGYPRIVKLGTFNKKTRRFQIRSSKTFSKQAPKGMVRININRLKHFLEVAANKVLR